MQRLGSSVTYRIALGPQAGRKALVLRTIAALSGEDPASERAAKAHGFSLHAGVGCEAHRRDERERLCRYIARPAVAAARGELRREFAALPRALRETQRPRAREIG